MAKFSYKAVNAAGQETSGAKDAKDRFELAEELRKQGYTLTSFKEEKGGGGSFVGKLQMISTVSISEKMIFARNMGVMVGAGVSMVKALEVLSRQTSNKKFKTVLLGLAGEIRKGRPLSEAMAGHPKIFSTLFCSMVRAGEASGKLEESLKLVANQLERDHDLRRKVKGAMMYPAIILIAMLIIGVLMMIYVVPTLTSTLKDLEIELPTSTKLIIAVSDFFASQSIIAVILTFAVLILAIYFVRSTAGKKVVAAIALRTPVISGLVKKMNSARTVRTFGSLIGAGVEVLEALQITQEVNQNKNFKEVVKESSKFGKINIVTADKGYDPNQNHEYLIRTLKIKSGIKIREKALGKRSTLRKKILKSFDEKTYHQRSKIETIFSVIKRKYDSKIRAKQTKTQIQESIQKTLTYNIDRLTKLISSLIKGFHQSSIWVSFL